MRGEDGGVLAIIDLYQNLAELERSTLQVRLQTWLFVGTATALMFFLLYGIVRQGSETIESQQAALARSRRQIQQAAVRAAALNEAAMRRLGADLHDGPAQDLGIALMRMEPLRAAVAAHVESGGEHSVDLDAASFDLQLIHTALQSSLQEIRNLAGGLRLPELSDLDLAETIRKAPADYARKTGKEVEIDGPQPLAGDTALKSAAYRLPLAAPGVDEEVA
ncbi:MAG: histidine kinase [Caldilineaceae bacterium]